MGRRSTSYRTEGGGDAANYEHITCDRDGRFMIVTLNRPEKLNAYTGQMGAEIADAFARAEATTMSGRSS